VPSASALNPGSGSFKTTIYFKSSRKPSSGGDFDLLRKGVYSTSGGDYKVEIFATGRAFCHFRGSQRVEVTGTSNVVDGDWHRITSSTSGSGVRLSVDGSTQASSSKDPGTISNTSSLRVGAKDSTHDETIGSLDSLKITKG
jgi:hypothetical protein